MRIPVMLGLSAVALSETTWDEGQGKAEPDAVVSELRLGTHWAGPEITHEDLIGKVVLVELWGS